LRVGGLGGVEGGKGKRSGGGGDKGLSPPWFVLVSAWPLEGGGCFQPCCHPDTSSVIWVNDPCSTCSLFTLFPCGQHNSLLCSSLFVLYSLSLCFTIAWHLLLRHLGLHLLPLITFTVTACVLVLSCLPPVPSLG
jgi:hypothetical protein